MTIVYDTNDASDRRSMHEEVLAIEALPFVTKLSQHAHSRSKAAGFRASLSCYATREHGGCGTQRESPICISLQRPTLLACLKELHARLKEKHLEKCINAAHALKEDNAAAQAAPTAAQQDVFKAMMLLEAAKQRAVIANKASLEAELEKDAAEQAVEILQSQLGQKRARQSDAAEEEEDDGEKSFHEWDLADYRREAKRVENRRAIELGSAENVKEVRRGDMDSLSHPRLGLVGWVSYWSRGSKQLAVNIIVSLCKRLDLVEQVSNASGTNQPGLPG